MHDILIGGLIALIVIIQILVALKTSSKISLFKSIVPKENTFQTVKVFIPENQIKSIKVESIFENLKNYTSIPTNEIQYDSVLDSVDNTYIENGEIEADNETNEKQVHFNDTKLYFEDEIDDFPIGLEDKEENIEEENEFVWVTKNNVEEKIKSCNLRQYQIEGWSKISY